MGAVTSVAGGVAAGAIGGPPGMIVGGIVGLARHLTSQPHETKEAPALQQAAQAITGIADAAEQVVALEADPVKSEAFRLKALEIRAATQEAERAHMLAMFKAANEDRAGARKQTGELVAAGSPIAWGAPVVSAILLLLFAAVMGIVLLKGVPSGDATATALINILLGTLAAMTTSVVSYWVGSSAGSARKDFRLTESEKAKQ